MKHNSFSFDYIISYRLHLFRIFFKLFSDGFHNEEVFCADLLHNQYLIIFKVKYPSDRQQNYRSIVSFFKFLDYDKILSRNDLLWKIPRLIYLVIDHIYLSFWSISYVFSLGFPL